MTAATTRVLLVEDNEAFREAVELLLGLEDGIDVVGSVGDGESAIALVATLGPDVVVIDYRLPDLDGVETARAVRERAPQAAIVALTAVAEQSEIDALLDAGAVSCLSKTEDLTAIVAAIRSAAAGPDR